MFALFLVIIVVLFGFGFLSSVWWVAAASVVVVATTAQYGRRGEGGGWDRDGGSGPGERQHHEKGRYRPRQRARWRRAARRDDGERRR